MCNSVLDDTLYFVLCPKILFVNYFIVFISASLTNDLPTSAKQHLILGFDMWLYLQNSLRYDYQSMPWPYLQFKSADG